jgi:hypothetical protein
VSSPTQRNLTFALDTANVGKSEACYLLIGLPIRLASETPELGLHRRFWHSLEKWPALPAAMAGVSDSRLRLAEAAQHQTEYKNSGYSHVSIL